MLEVRTFRLQATWAHENGAVSRSSVMNMNWYNATTELNQMCALQNSEEDERDITVTEYELLAQLSDKIIAKEFRSGPFVIDHNDLMVQNILVRKNLSAKAKNTG